MNFVHQEPSFASLLTQVADQAGVAPALVEKDYWIVDGYAEPLAAGAPRDRDPLRPALDHDIRAELGGWGRGVATRAPWDVRRGRAGCPTVLCRAGVGSSTRAGACGRTSITPLRLPTLSLRSSDLCRL
jgi:hypothetical protein